ncbi:DnaJ domain-containing protein [Globomyces pollinis-pini]|nr:DnaJ domain-containing protein [Globomyces pollinis-pini]
MTTKRKPKTDQNKKKQKGEEDIDETIVLDDAIDPNFIDLYKELGIQKTATLSDIKSAYKRKALELHPDKHPQELKEQKTLEFQKLTLYYKVLVNPTTRERYDRTGSIDEKDDLEKDDEMSWTDYFESLRGQVTEQSIQQYEKQYRYSLQERVDILAAYAKTKGSLLAMTDEVPCCTLDDLDRFKEIVQEAIDNGEVPLEKKFPKIIKKELEKRKKKALEEAKLIEEMNQKNEKENELIVSEQSLQNTLKERNQARMESLIASIAAKHTNPKGKSKAVPSEPSEEEFQAIQAQQEKRRMEAADNQKTKKRK